LNSNFRHVLPVYFTLVLWNTIWAISITGPVMPLYVESLGVDVIGWSVLAAASSLGMFLLEWIWGSLCDRIDRRLLMIASVLSMSVFFALYTLHGLVPYFIVLQLISGAVAVVIGPTTRSYVSDESPEKSIGLYASLWWAFHTLGRTIGPLLGTYIAQIWSFEYSFYASSVLSIILAFIILVTLPGDRKRRRTGSQKSIVHNLKSVLNRRSAQYLFLSTMFAFMGLSVIRAFLPIYASGQVKMSTVDVGVLLASFSGAQLVSMPLLGLLSDRFGRKRTTILGFILSACMFLLYFVAGTSSELLMISTAVGVGLAGTSLLLAMIPDVTSNTMHGTAVGIYGSFEDLGIIIGPLLFGFVWSIYGPVFIFAAAALTQVLGALLVFAIKRKQ
jgi:MFS family permease